MAEQTELEREVAGLIAEAVNLEITPEEIDPKQPLFGEGLGLDSIDLLEMALAISKKYGFQLRSNDAGNAQIFSSLSALTAHVSARRVK
ncbi:MAG: phosphopantetheine-binding protein [Burkholderiales bacterium]